MKPAPSRRLILIVLLAASLALAALAVRRTAGEPDAVSLAQAAQPVAQVAQAPAAAAPAPSVDLSAYRSAYLQPASAPGVAAPNIPRSTGFIWPVVGPITQPFGVPELGVGAPHTGVDIAQAVGSPVRAAAAGRIVFAGGDPCCDLGYWVEINHGDHYATRYGHLMRPPTVVIGSYVAQGQVIGFSGSTGFSTGPHVHFEVRRDGVPIDPLGVLPGASSVPWDLSR